jgi:hypothetical protein
VELTDSSDDEGVRPAFGQQSTGASICRLWISWGLPAAAVGTGLSVLTWTAPFAASKIRQNGIRIGLLKGERMMPTPSDSRTAAAGGGPPTYVLVILSRHGAAADQTSEQAAHELFITDLIKRNTILLGGGFGAPIGDAEAAYVLRCSVDQADVIASEDPLVASAIMKAECVEWELVGINPDAIDASVTIRSRDV